MRFWGFRSNKAIAAAVDFEVMHNSQLTVCRPLLVNQADGGVRNDTLTDEPAEVPLQRESRNRSVSSLRAVSLAEDREGSVRLLLSSFVFVSSHLLHRAQQPANTIPLWVPYWGSLWAWCHSVSSCQKPAWADKPKGGRTTGPIRAVASHHGTPLSTHPLLGLGSGLVHRPSQATVSTASTVSTCPPTGHLPAASHCEPTTTILMHSLSGLPSGVGCIQIDPMDGNTVHKSHRSEILAPLYQDILQHCSSVTASSVISSPHLAAAADPGQKHPKSTTTPSPSLRLVEFTVFDVSSAPPAAKARRGSVLFCRPWDPELSTTGVFAYRRGRGFRSYLPDLSIWRRWDEKGSNKPALRNKTSFLVASKLPATVA
ncbi:hypothetical protein B0H66DRAFT_609416 [Apodospora peruviana]|uniref:Uncharacterized protein n=1 Tax=Apodospora peruviana TaxID=516989 RepID=A0AAE0MDT4_9PEZI|nr:hypothetical protein B0H66DRAFT_609416 [Apodospora peruviana]